MCRKTSMDASLHDRNLKRAVNNKTISRWKCTRCADDVYESGNVIMQTHHLSTVPCHELLGSGLCPLSGEPPVRWRGVLDLKSPASHPRTLPLPFQPGFLTPSPQTNGKSRFYVVLRTISDNSVCVVGDRPKFLIPMSHPAALSTTLSHFCCH